MRSSPSLLFLLIVITCSHLWMGCSSSSSNLLRSPPVLVRTEEHLGEYLQVESETSLFTVNRTPGSLQGVVRVTLPKQSIEQLDSQAVQARDLHADGSKLVYRVDHEIRFYSGSISTLPMKVDRVRSLKWFGDYGRATFDVENSKESRWVTLNSSGKILGEGTLEGSPRTHSKDGNQQEIFAVQTAAGFDLLVFSSSPSTAEMRLIRKIPIDQGSVGIYADAALFSKEFALTYFDHNNGVLKMAHCPRNLSEGNCTTEIVAGTLGQSYIGHDPALFDDGGIAGVCFNDPRNGKAYCARKGANSGEWKSQELPIHGFVGFYNRILKSNERTLHLGMHNFRTSHADRSQTFEDLALLEINLDLLGR